MNFNHTLSRTESKGSSVDYRYPTNDVVTNTPVLPQYASPIANMLANVAFIVRDKTETNQDLAVMTAINHILVEVLGRTDIGADTIICMEQMMINVNGFASKIRARRIYKRNMSRSSTTTPGNTFSPIPSPLGNNINTKRHPLSIAPSIEELEEPKEVSSPLQLASQPEDMIDGPIANEGNKEEEDTDEESDSEECTKVKIAQDIADKLHQWLSRHRSSIIREINGDGSNSARIHSEAASHL